MYDSPVTGSARTLTYAQLLEQVSRFGGALQALGVGKGDRVVIYMPMVPEAVVAMLACARIGAVHSVVFGGFAPAELAARIEDARPRVIVSASCGIEPSRVVEYKPMLDAAIERSSHEPEHCVILQREQVTAAMGERDVDWATLMHPDATTGSGCVTGGGDRPALHPLHLRHHRPAQGDRARQRRPRRGADLVDAQHLRGRPRRGVVDRQRRRLGGRPLLHRLRAAAGRVHDGALRGQAGGDAGRRRVLAGGRAVRRVRDVHGPTAIRAVKKEDASGALMAGHDLSSLRTLFLAGERLDPDT